MADRAGDYVNVVKRLLRPFLEQLGVREPTESWLKGPMNAVDARLTAIASFARSRLAEFGLANPPMAEGTARGVGILGAAPVSSVVRTREFEHKQPIAILGYDEGTLSVLKTAIAFGLTPIVVHAPNGSVSAGTKINVSPREIRALGIEPAHRKEGRNSRIDVVGENDFCCIVRERHLPVLVGTLGFQDRDCFRENLLFARRELKLTGRILHPACLCDFHRDSNRRFAIIGFPGSGNMIVQNICWRLLPASGSPVWARNPLSAAVTQFALSYWSSLQLELASAFDKHGRWQDVSGPTHLRYGSIYIALRDQKSEVFVAGLPQRSLTWSNPWHMSHEPLTAQSLSFLTDQNFHVMQIMRHPLDLIVSNAAKITIASGDRVPQLLLQNDDWMNGILESVEAYYAGIAEHQGSNGVSFVRYEELMANPVRTIRHMADILGVECHDRDAEQLWAELGNKPIVSDGHLWEPGAGKWREFISPRFAERICGSRLREYAEAVGYRLEAGDFEGTRAEVPPYTCDPMYIAWEEGRWELLTGKRPAIEHPDVYRRHDEASGLLMICGRQYEETMEGLRTSPVLHDLLSAGRLEAWSEPPLVADLLGLG